MPECLYRDFSTFIAGIHIHVIFSSFHLRRCHREDVALIYAVPLKCGDVTALHSVTKTQTGFFKVSNLEVLVAWTVLK